MLNVVSGLRGGLRPFSFSVVRTKIKFLETETGNHGEMDG